MGILEILILVSIFAVIAAIKSVMSEKKRRDAAREKLREFEEEHPGRSENYKRKEY